MEEEKTPRVETQMTIRKPVSTVFDAFIDPTITTKFWSSMSDGKLVQGKTVTWEWEMYKISTKVFIKAIIPNQLISMEWGTPTTTVVYEFIKLGPDTTYVTIKNYGFQQKGAHLREAIKDNTGGFTTVLDGLKAYLEHNLIADKYLAKR